MEDNLLWQATFYGRQPLLKDDLWWKKSFDERHVDRQVDREGGEQVGRLMHNA